MRSDAQPVDTTGGRSHTVDAFPLEIRVPDRRGEETGTRSDGGLTGRCRSVRDWRLNWEAQ